MREHVTPAARIHYVVTSRGSAPNVVPSFAESYIYVQHPDPEESRRMFDWVTQIAEAAAMGTETRMEHEVIHGIYNVLPNEALARAMFDNLNEVGGVEYNAEEREFAEAIHHAYAGAAPPLERAQIVRSLSGDCGGEGRVDRRWRRILGGADCWLGITAGPWNIGTFMASCCCWR